MTADLKTQIGAYGGQLVEDQAPLNSEEVLAMVRLIREIPPAPAGPSRISLRRGIWVAAATAVVILVLIGGVTWLVRSPGGVIGRVITEPPAPTLTTVPTPTTTVPTPTTVVPAPTTPTPSPRIQSGMAYDAESNRIIIFGGTTSENIGGDLYGDTWSYDLNLNTWTDMNPAEAPSPRSDFNMAYDAESDRVVAFGGGTWAYDYNTNTWRNMSPVTSPAGAGPMVYDAESDRVVLFLVWTGAPDNETWTYDFNTNTWTKMEPATRPSPRTWTTMAYDAESDRVILFGGIAGRDNDETWAYDLNTNTWTKMLVITRPSPRHSHALAYDTESDRVVLFGGHLPSGQSAIGVHSDETWAYDFNTNTWTNMEPPTQPLKLAAHNLAYDAESDKVVLFGGDTNGVLSDETWAYDLNANTWTDLSPVGQESQ